MLTVCRVTLIPFLYLVSQVHSHQDGPTLKIPYLGSHSCLQCDPTSHKLYLGINVHSFQDGPNSLKLYLESLFHRH